MRNSEFGIANQCAHRCGDPYSLPPLKSGEGDREAVVGFSDKQQTPKEPLSLATLDSSP